jgi:hypothetical protein
MQYLNLETYNGVVQKPYVVIHLSSRNYQIRVREINDSALVTKKIKALSNLISDEPINGLLGQVLVTGGQLDKEL